MATEVRSEMAGTVWKIVAKAGDEVEEEDPIVILESMKMEIPVESPVDGTVKELKVAEGDSVQEEDLIALVEED